MIVFACWEIFGANILATGCRLICFFTPKLRYFNASNAEVLLHPWLVKKEFCCMADPDSLPYLRIAHADLVEAQRMVKLTGFRDSSIGFRLQ